MPVNITYTAGGLVLSIPYADLAVIQCVCGCLWTDHNPCPWGTTAHDRYCLQCPCLGFVPRLAPLAPKEPHHRGRTLRNIVAACAAEETR